MGLAKEELMHGNFVQHEDSIYRVLNIEDSGMVYVQGNDNKRYWVQASRLKGVAIDSDWLEVFGFKASEEPNDYLQSYWMDRRFYIAQSKVDDNVMMTAGNWYVGDDWTNVKYIHELQNYHYWVHNFKNKLAPEEVQW